MKETLQWVEITEELAKTLNRDEYYDVKFNGKICSRSGDYIQVTKRKGIILLPIMENFRMTQQPTKEYSECICGKEQAVLTSGEGDHYCQGCQTQVYKAAQQPKQEEETKPLKCDFDTILIAKKPCTMEMTD